MSSAIWRAPWIYSGPVIAILFSHYLVDVYSSVVPPLIGVVQTEFGMQSATAAMLLGMGSICSGLAQPLFAWVSDRTGTRVFGALGVLFACVFICLIGFSRTTFHVFSVYAIGMIGIGMFHPIATAKIGAIAGDQRGFAISLFFVFGMGGFFTGSLLGPYLVTVGGSTKTLSYLLIPGLVMVLLLQLNINRNVGKSVTKKISDVPLASYDWWSIVPLYFSAVFRFMVNMAIIYLIVRWVESDVALSNPELSKREISQIAAPGAGRAHAIMFLGQGLSGLIAGAWIKLGQESRPLVLTPFIFAPFLMSLAYLQPGWFSYAICLFVGVGFAAMTPITISVGQRLMPGHTRLASGMMLGGAWALGSIGPGLAECSITYFGLPNAILLTGAVLMLAGATSIYVQCPSEK